MDARKPTDHTALLDILVPVIVFFLALAFVIAAIYYDYAFTNTRPFARRTSLNGYLLTFFFVNLGGAVLFSLGMPRAISRAHRQIPLQASRMSVLTLVFGASFPIWGTLLALACGGILGVLHAAVCTAFMGTFARSTPLAIAAFPALAAAWSCTWLIADHADTVGWESVELASVSMVAISIWNLEMLAVGLVWARLHPRRQPYLLDGKCPNCLYDRAGIACDAPCPECGCRVRTITPQREDKSCPS